MKQGYNINQWKHRVILVNDFNQISPGVKFAYVISTFVLQHLGYRYDHPTTMNLTDITQQIKSMSNQDAVWFALEHDSEEDWIPRWMSENNINLSVYERSYKGLPELTERDHTAPNGGHHLMIFKI